jgi:cytochrome c peroxidase
MRDLVRAMVLAPVLSIGCSNLPGDGVDRFTDEEWEIIEQFALTGGPPPNSTNNFADDPAAAALGQQLFFERAYSKELKFAGSGLGEVGESGKVSCASCHDPLNYYTDTRSRPAATSLGVQWTNRNTPSLVNSTYYVWGSWGGKDDIPWHQGANGSESSQNFGGNRLEFVHIVYRKYRDAYDAIFPVPLDPALDPEHPDAARFPPSGKPKAPDKPDGAWEMMAKEDRTIVNQILANTGKAYEAYERLLVSQNAPIDRYIAGEYDALTPGAKRGLALFIGKAACVDCHRGPTFTDHDFHNIGIPQTYGTANRIDFGRFDDLTRTLSSSFNGAGPFSDDPEAGAAKLDGLEPTEEMKGLFRTQSLRHIEKTAPYMHNGSLASLTDVVRFYNWGGGQSDYPGVKHPALVPLGLTSDEEQDLVEFLKALTGEPTPTELAEDTAIHDPPPEE